MSQDTIDVKPGTVEPALDGGDSETITIEEYWARKEAQDTQDGFESRKQSMAKYPIYSDRRYEGYYGSTSTGAMADTYGVNQDATAADWVDYPAQLWAEDPEELKNLSKTLKGIPGFDNDGDVDDVTSKFGDFLENLSNSGLAMDPLNALNYFEQMAKAQGYKGPGGSGGSGGYSGPRKTVTLTNEFDAEALVNGALNGYLGRDASEEEVEEFWKKLNKAEKKNPLITNSAPGSTDTKGGYNSQLAAQKYAESRDDYADTQVRTTYKELMENAIRGRLDETVEGML